MSARATRAAALVAALLLVTAAFGLGRCTAAPTPGGGPDGAAADDSYTCSMHPQILRPEPGECPICGMDLVLVSSLQAGEPLAANQVALSPRARALAGVRTVRVARASARAGGLRLSGRVALDETSERLVTAWIGGRIERLHVRVTGARVLRGQTVATLYSPEIYAAARDLRAAAQQLERLSGGTALARTAAEATLASTRERLRLLGVPAAEIDRMQARDDAARRVAIRSPFAGTVLERLTTEGAYVTPGAPLYRVADLDTLWVQLDAFEADLPRLAVGQPVRVSVEGSARDGRVAFVDPVVDPRTGSARVRVEVPNDDGALRPGMLAEATVAGEAAASELMIPASAALFTGRRSLVYVEVPGRASPTFEARVVRLGPRAGERYPVLEGLEEGERVVVEGAFAIDADLQIRGGASMMARDPAPAISPDVLAAVLEAYLGVQAALADDALESAQTAAATLATRAAAEPQLAVRGEEARRIVAAEDLSAARAAFDPLSQALIALVRAAGNPLPRALRVAFCPMAFGNRGAEWIQSSDVIDNAYFGDAMLACGSFREVLPPARAQPNEPTESTEPPEPTEPRRRRARPAPRPAPAPAPVDHSHHHHGATP